MDLGKIIDEIVPWLILAGMLLPYLKSLKKRRDNARKQQAHGAQHRPSSHNYFSNQPRTRRPLVQSYEPAASTLPEKSIPEEGVRATADTPAEASAPQPRHLSPRRKALRNAIIVGELLARRS